MSGAGQPRLERLDARELKVAVVASVKERPDPVLTNAWAEIAL